MRCSSHGFFVDGHCCALPVLLLMTALVGCAGTAWPDLLDHIWQMSAASCLPLCRTLLEAASSPRKAVDDLFSPANERAVRVALRVTGSVAAVAAFASMF